MKINLYNKHNLKLIVPENIKVFLTVVGIYGQCRDNKPNKREVSRNRTPDRKSAQQRG